MIKGEHIYLRAIELEDIDTLYDMENDIRNWKVSETKVPFSRYTVEQYVLSCGSQDLYTLRQVRMMICCNAGKEVIGCLDLYDFDPTNERAAVGILLTEASRKKGFASESLELLLHYASDILNIKQLYCYVDNSNKDSLNLFESHGFVRCGCFKSWMKVPGGKWEDVHMLQHLLY